VSTTPASRDGRVRVVVATTVLLSFISFWRAAAIVLADLGSTAFYVGGIVEQAVGKSAPWFILGVMIFSYAVRALYIESSAMFVRGGVYRVVKEAMGGTLAKLSVSALLFDYILTGPISGVSAGSYIGGLVNDILARAGSHARIPTDAAAASIAIAITVYFWRRNTRGIHESSEDAMTIMKIATVMVVLLIAWCALTLVQRGGALPPLPASGSIQFSDGAVGWLKGTVWPTFTAIAILVGFGHSILAMSGEESLAQVYREIEVPKVKNLQRAGMVIFIYSLVFTGLVSFFAAAIIPDAVRPQYYDNLISGLAMHVVGPVSLRLVFQAVVVIVGFLMLAGAVNTAIVGSNGVLNRVSEDGVLTEWFRKPHHRFGTTYRLINLIAILQVVTILISRGNVILLGEAYAFGVVWSFAFNALAVLVPRYKRPDIERGWKVPLNVRIGGRELPIGVTLIAISLFTAAAINLFTKETATISGLLFTGGFFVVFMASERITARQKGGRGRHARSVPADARGRGRHRGVEQSARSGAGAGARLQHAGAAGLGGRTHAAGAGRDRADDPAAARAGRQQLSRAGRRRALHRLRANLVHQGRRHRRAARPRRQAARAAGDQHLRRGRADRGHPEGRRDRRRSIGGDLGRRPGAPDGTGLGSHAARARADHPVRDPLRRRPRGEVLARRAPAEPDAGGCGADPQAVGGRRQGGRLERASPRRRRGRARQPRRGVPHQP
jgi:amino acid transporter